MRCPLNRVNSTSVRLGRQEIDAQGNRLLAVREVSNLRRTFDLALAAIRYRGHELQIFSGRPVVNADGPFDDRWSPTEHLTGVIDTWRPSSWSRASQFGFFFLDRTVVKRASTALLLEERRRTFGLRTTVTSADWEGAAQASWQWGYQGPRPIRAYGVAGELVRNWPAVFGAPRLGVSFGWASGDANPARGATATFDVLYPNLDYFTDAPLSYPGNTRDVRPTLRWSPLSGLSLQAGADWIYRIERSDAVYTPPGVILIAAGHGPGGRVSTLTDLRATLHCLRRWDLTLSGVHGNAGPVLVSGGAKNANFLLFQLSAKL